MGLVRLLLAISVLLVHSPLPDEWHTIPIVGGDLAVESFFMISGFYMAMVLTDNYSGRSGTSRAYGAFLLSRILRIYPTYLIVLACAALFLLFTDRGWFVRLSTLGLWPALFGVVVNLTIVGQEITLWIARTAEGLVLTTDFRGLPPPQLLNFMLIPQAWSLSLELCFYFLAPALNRLSWIFLISLIVVCFLARLCAYTMLGLAHDPWTFRFFPFELGIFVTGMVAYRIYAIRLKAADPFFARVVLGISIAAMLFFQVAPRPVVAGFQVADSVFLLGLFFAIPYIFLATRKSGADRLVGELSYPVYLTHIFAFWLLSRFIVWPPNSRLLYVSASIALTLGISTLLLIFVDRRMDRVRKNLADQMLRYGARGKTLAPAM